jgi:predicted DNA-binding protein
MAKRGRPVKLAGLVSLHVKLEKESVRRAQLIAERLGETRSTVLRLSIRVGLEELQKQLAVDL